MTAAGLALVLSKSIVYAESAVTESCARAAVAVAAMVARRAQ
jgi:hypothetical protein